MASSEVWDNGKLISPSDIALYEDHIGKRSQGLSVKTRGRVTLDRCSSSISDQGSSPTRGEGRDQKTEGGGQKTEEAGKGGFTVYTDSVEQFRPEKAYDLVALSDVFEHSLFPRRMLNSVITMIVLHLTSGMFRIALRGLISRLFLKQSGVW